MIMSGNEGWTPAVTVFFLSTDIFVLDHPRSMRAYVLLVFYFFYIFSDFYQTNNLNT